jgi:heterodisulfide reductase subunit B
MKEYAYFPGCSLEKIAISYHQSSLEMARKLGVELKELEDWNCCGATAYFHVDELLAYTLSARNIAMAEKANLDLVAPCSACYKNTFFTNKYLLEDPDLADHVNYALEEDDLSFSGTIKIKHLMEVLVDDVGLDEIKNKVKKPLEGLRVAAYYGCQILRPRKNGEDFEDVEDPDFFEALLSAVGAEPVDYSLKAYCCGGSLILTSREAALSMCRNLLQHARDREAAMIATACPMCQINLECYQTQVNQEFGTDFKMPIVYFTQLVGLALGIAPKKLGIGKELISAASLKPYSA